jgi:hypothetical protein
MYLRAFSIFLALSVSSAFCQSLPDISGTWNGAVCKGMGDMLVSGSPQSVATTGFIHLELTVANNGSSDVRYDVDVTTYDEKGSVRDHQVLPYNPTHYGHGVQSLSAGGFFFSATSTYKEPMWDMRNVAFGLGAGDSSQGSGSYTHSDSRGTHLGELEFTIVHDGQSVQQYIARHLRPCQ